MGLVVSSFSYFSVLLGILISAAGTSIVSSPFIVWSFLVVGSLSVCG